MIRVRHHGSIATIALERAKAKNALPTAAWEALAEAAREVASARVVILRSDVPGIFSAGADVREFERLQADPALRTRFRSAMRGAIDAIAALAVPVIAAIDGGCFGAAVGLALAADFRIAGDGAEFATTPARLGLGYPEQDVARLAAQVGRGMAGVMLFTGDRVAADEARRIGLVELRAANAAEAAAQLAETIAGNAPRAVRLLKRALSGEICLDPEFDAAFGGAEFAEGLRAFSERRKPVYQ
jgi:enoyl-CoA hydratase/carnithine racemase